MIHTSDEGPTAVGDHCSITHHVTLHGCIIEDDCLIGIGATIMDSARIGAGSIVAGGAFVPEGREYPPHSIIMGSPAKVRSVRDSRVQVVVADPCPLGGGLCAAVGFSSRPVGDLPELLDVGVDQPLLARQIAEQAVAGA